MLDCFKLLMHSPPIEKNLDLNQKKKKKNTKKKKKKKRHEFDNLCASTVPNPNLIFSTQVKVKYTTQNDIA